MTLDEQIKSVGRELGLRRAVYPKFIIKGTMTKSKADHEIACMESVYETLKRLPNDGTYDTEKPEPARTEP